MSKPHPMPVITAEQCEEIKSLCEKALAETPESDEEKLMHLIAGVALACATAKPVGYGHKHKITGEYGSWLKPKNLAHECARYAPEPLYEVPPVANPNLRVSLPDNWAVVPREASPAQWAAGQKAFDAAGINKVEAVYKVMVNAGLYTCKAVKPVVLPQGYSVVTGHDVCRPGGDQRPVMLPKSDGNWLDRHAVEFAIRAAGGEVES